MKDGKHTKKKFKIIEIYSVLIFIVTLFMSIGYAQISDVLINITGSIEATSQENVFIADVKNTNENIGISKINNYIATTLDSTIELNSSDSNSTVSYEITLYNNSEKDFVFIDTLTDKSDITLYDNENIEFIIEGIENYKTTIAPTQSLKFLITFKYIESADLSKNILNCKLNFRFKELPKLFLDNDGQTYELNDIYPDYTPQEYQFMVSNYYSDTEISSVPMTYSFKTTIGDGPLVAKIYDIDGNEVNEEITIGGDGQTYESYSYVLKIIWDNSKLTEKYNDSYYADKNFKCNVELVAIPNDESYIEYKISKEFNINIMTAKFNFNVSPTTANITILNNVATLDVSVDNYNSNIDYNKYDVEYDMSLIGNNNFSFSIENISATNNMIKKTLKGNSKISDSYEVKFTADMANLDITEEFTLKIDVIYPYIKTIEIHVTINLHKVTVTLNANGGTVGTSSFITYQNRTYPELPTPTYTGHTFNGWYTDKTGGTQVTNSTIVTTTSSTQTLYARWTSRLLADFVSVGDYVNYPVSYSNVETNGDGGYVAKSSYTGWRVLSVDGSGDNRYVRLVTAGIPMSYVHPATTTSGTTSVTALTTNFFSTAINSTSTNYTFRKCGFKNSSGTTIGTIANLKTLFTNDYTQTSSNVPIVKAMTKADLDSVWGSTTGNETYLTSNDLLAIPATTSGYYASYHLASYNVSGSKYYLWNVYYTSGAIIYTNGEHGIRPVVSLNTTVETTGKNSNGVWQLK